MKIEDEAHKKRILTAIITLPPLIWIILWSPFFIFVPFIFLVGLLASIEYARLWKLPPIGLLRFFYLFFSLLVLGGFIVFSPLLGLIIAFFLMVIYFVWAYGYKRELISFLPVVGLGLFYPNLFLGYAFSFTNLSQGRLLLLWSLFIIFVADAGAFYIGSNFGKHKIYSLISPNKSWEGLIGGIGSTLVFGILSTIWLPVSLLKILSLSLIMAILGSIGDFFESVLKRQADIKDSSGILPGHGGLLDRIDGVLFALPVSYYFWQWWLR